MNTLVFALSVAFTAVLTALVCLLVQRKKKPTQAKKQPSEAKKKSWAASKLIAFGVLFVDATATYFVLYLCWLAITTQYEGALPYLTTLIGALQFATGYVLGHYFKKATAENTMGGITYDAALGVSTQEEAQG